MNKPYWALWLCLFAVPSHLVAIPSAITYQGALKDKGMPASGTKTMKFQITNQTGTNVYWTSGDTPVSVTNGFFSTQISPVGVDWEHTTPYLEVSVEGQQLLPREPVNASVYAQVAQSVADGSVTPGKITTGYGLVPTGMVGLFTANCPSGWARFSALDGLFPLGATTSGATGGQSTHHHSLLVTRTLSGGGATVVGTERSGSGNALLQFGGSGGFTVDARSADTDVQNHMPPYLTMVYCQKQ